MVALKHEQNAYVFFKIWRMSILFGDFTALFREKNDRRERSRMKMEHGSLQLYAVVITVGSAIRRDP
jgi:hypothetical protein